VEDRRFVDSAARAANRRACTGALDEIFGRMTPAARRRAALAVSAQMLGLADRMIAMTVEHVRAREQFRVPVGSQQAVQHMRALVALEHARPVVYRAGWVASTPEAGAPDLAVSFGRV
jgi:alkylation response protein AidB-like acyl-CoA dehydrogenase